MDEILAYSTLAATVTLAVSRPRIGLRGIRVTPGAAAIFGVVALVLAGLLGPADLAAAGRIQWRPLLSLTCVMIMTGVVQEVGAFDRLALKLESYARRTSAARVFGVLFVASTVTPALLNNDSAILLLTPLVVALARRLYPARPALTQAFAFVVFLAPGVAPFAVSNPMNMIVAQFAGIGFNAYALTMLPISLAGALLTLLVLRLRFRRLLADASAATAGVVEVAPGPHPAERPVAAVLVGVFTAYPCVAATGAPIWPVSVAGVAASLLLAWRYRVGPPRRLFGHVSPDVLAFLWGVFAVVIGLRRAGVVDRLAALYGTQAPGSWQEIGIVGLVAAMGSAVVDNHPMAMLDMMALGAHADGGRHVSILAALIGGDIGPRLLPIGSLAGLLWMDLMRRSGEEVPAGAFIRLGALVLLPTLALSLAILWLLSGAT